MKNQFHLILILFLIVIVGCGPSAETDDPENGALDSTTIENNSAVVAYPSVNSGYPGLETGYPGNNVDLLAHLPSEMLPVPNPTNNETGTVTGILLTGVGEKVPMRGAILYLGEIVTIDNNTPALSSLNKQIAPTTQSSQVGQFIFTDVPAGRYTLVYDLITATFVLNQPGGGDFIIEVTGGDIVDLGELHYDDLPTLDQ